MKVSFTDRLEIRSAEAADGSAVWQLVKDAGTLDVNSPYCYIMLCDIFRDTCAAAVIGEELVGFMSGYRRPDRPDTLFIWQVAVHPKARGRGIAKAMLKELLNREEQQAVKYVEATIGPANTASRRLFSGFAADRGTQCRITEQYGPELFPSAATHEPELLFRIGPMHSAETRN